MRGLLSVLWLASCATPEPDLVVDNPIDEPDPIDEPEPEEPMVLDGLIAVHTIEGPLLSLVDASTGDVLARHELDGRAGDHPIIADERVYATLRDERSLVVYAPTADGLEEAWRVEVGPEPRGLVLDLEAGRALVAVSNAHEVVEVLLDEQRIGRAWTVKGHPTWLTPLPDGRILVGSRLGEQLHRLDPAEYGVDAVPLPERFREDGTRYTMRVTGAPALDVDDGVVWVPTMYMDPITPVGGVVQDDQTPPPPPDGYYVDESPSPTMRQSSRFQFALAGLDLDLADPAGGSIHHLAAQFGSAEPARGLISAVYADPESNLVLAALEGSRSVLAARPLVDSGVDPVVGFEQDYAVTIRSPDGPRTLRPVGDQVWTYGFLDRTLATFDLPFLRAEVPERPRIAILSPHLRAEIAPTLLGAAVDHGRSLFFSSIDDRMVLPGGGLSCATCHIDGGTDGLTWILEDGPRQTPSLAGPKSQTLPVTWTRSVPTVADEVLLTAERRMGGERPSRASAELAAAFIDQVPYPDTQPMHANELAIERGRDIFDGSAQCSACHSGPDLTNRSAHDMVGEEAIRTPTLRGISATGPYFHDGSAATLAEVVERAEDEGMGKTNHLDPRQKADLVAYLESL